MSDSITSKMTKEEMVNVLVILMDISSIAEAGFRSSISSLPVKTLNIMYETWVRASNICEVAKKETRYAKEHLAVAERRIASLEKDLAKARKVKK